MSGKAVGSTVEPCPLVWVSIRLERKARNPAPSWWRKEDQRPYQAESFEADLGTSSCEQATLNDQGKHRFEGVPPGTCAFAFVPFYDDIEKYLREKSK
jgi:hypothetical protein